MITSSEILNDISTVFGIPIEQIKAKGRSDEFSICRKIFVYVCINKARIAKADISRKINRESSYCKNEMKIIHRNISDNDPKWLVFWNKYQQESKLWSSL